MTTLSDGMSVAIGVLGSEILRLRGQETDCKKAVRELRETKEALVRRTEDARRFEAMATTADHERDSWRQAYERQKQDYQKLGADFAAVVTERNALRNEVDGERAKVARLEDELRASRAQVEGMFEHCEAHSPEAKPDGAPETWRCWCNCVVVVGSACAMCGRVEEQATLTDEDFAKVKKWMTKRASGTRAKGQVRR